MSDSSVASDPKQRFSDRVEDYVRYRPRYPREILDALRKECGLRQESVVADIGSGTGFLAQIFLENGNLVYGVEPNAAMREAGEQLLATYPHFCSVAGSAEATTLPAASVDLVVVGQAFHWFEPRSARSEFSRVLRANGWVAVLWNERLADTTPFLREYELLVRKFGTDYEKVSATYPRQEQMETFFGPAKFGENTFAYEQIFDFDGLRGRLLSSSYTPPPGHSNHEPMLVELKRLFDAHQHEGRVRFEYTTHIFYGQVAQR